MRATLAIDLALTEAALVLLRANRVLVCVMLLGSAVGGDRLDPAMSTVMGLLSGMLVGDIYQFGGRRSSWCDQLERRAERMWRAAPRKDTP